ncbi:hypothetical protein AKJ40_01220 [candidate division MSBL1 archaeon SCGC-AAA259M10]|uniref:Transposase IS116/IS110/IS902 C-terminal domain-containing protein n=1 Tax=candidate division MSBL1 archaeon SCGC-AAA259M10 TaxID=1698270 RepID=A0A133V246_9EURY|nr:hypothetical protein AKJ40_01220 [candidate division MSBL1 archaeon SCGC-AAA259M10]
MNRIKAMLRKKGIELDLDLRTNKDRRKLLELEISSINDHLEVIETLDNRIERVEEEVEDIEKDIEDVEILRKIPGIDYNSALTIIAEITTVERFPTAGHLCSYAGLVPSVKESGSKEVYGLFKVEDPCFVGCSTNAPLAVFCGFGIGVADMYSEAWTN